MNERKGKGQQSRLKPYSAPVDKGKQRMVDDRRPKKKDAPTEIVCFNCGVEGDRRLASAPNTIEVVKYRSHEDCF